MRICIPVKEKNGLGSRVAKKLRTAKAFAIIDMESPSQIDDIRFIEAENLEKDEIIPFLASHGIDLFVVNEITEEDKNTILDMGIDIVTDAFGRINTVLEKLFSEGV